MKKNCCILLILLIAIALVSCTSTSYNEKENYTDNFDDIILLSTYTIKQYDSGALELGEIISFHNYDQFESNKNISKLFLSDSKPHYFKSVMNDSDTVIIQTDIIFQSANGYVATKKELSSIHTENNKETIPNITSSFFGYDANQLAIDHYLGEFEEWYLYSYTAGL